MGTPLARVLAELKTRGLLLHLIYISSALLGKILSSMHQYEKKYSQFSAVLKFLNRSRCEEAWHTRHRGREARIAVLELVLYDASTL